MNKEYIRSDGRTAFQLRELKVLKDYIRYAEGSVLIEMGNTKVVCTASVEEKVPPFLKGTGKGWITAEYSMLPRSTHNRSIRDASRGKVGGRTHEIQRLIGRSLRAVVNLDTLGERTIWIDCDVIQADGGTRTISITGAFIAMIDALRSLNRNGIINSIPVLDSVAAVSVGKVRGNLLLDLNYEEDSYADVDMNLVMTGKGEIVEIQGTAETMPFNKKELFDMVEIGCRGIKGLSLKQKEVLEDFNLSPHLSAGY